MEPTFTIVAQGEAAGEAAFANELATAGGGEAEREEAGLGPLQMAHDIWSFVVVHKEAIHTTVDLAAAAVKVVGAMIGLAERRKVKMTLVEGGRELTIEAGRRADLEQMMTTILGRFRPPAGPADHDR